MNNPIMKIWKNVGSTMSVVIYNMPNTTNARIVDMFHLLDVWGSRCYDRFNDDGLYFELPIEMYDILPTLPFVKANHIDIQMF